MPTITVKRYGRGSWAVFVDDELLCVTVYKKGANAVRNALLNLFSALPLTAFYQL
jgi:hypothetical protein